MKRWSGHRKVTHFKALPYAQMPPGVVDKILYSQGMRETRHALAFVVLTATRSGEVRGARWEEIDLEAGVWSIPAERMKSDRPHQIPLSLEAQLILQDAREAIKPTFPIWLNIPLSKSSAFFKPLSICETLAVGMAIITP